MPFGLNYMDDYDMEWEDHLKGTHAYFDKLPDARLTVNLDKFEFGKELESDM